MLDSDEDIDGEMMAEQMLGLQAAGPAQGIPGSEPAGQGPLFAGTRGPLQSQPHFFEPPAWSPGQAALPAAPEAETFDMAQDDSEGPADHDPYGSSQVGGDSPGRESQSTPRRWVSNVVGGTDLLLRSPLAFYLLAVTDHHHSSGDFGSLCASSSGSLLDGALAALHNRGDWNCLVWQQRGQVYWDGGCPSTRLCHGAFGRCSPLSGCTACGQAGGSQRCRLKCTSRLPAGGGVVCASAVRGSRPVAVEAR